MRPTLALLSILCASVLMSLVPQNQGSHHLGVRAVLADDGNPACLLPPDSGELDGAGHKVTWLPTTPEPNETQVPPQRSGGTDCPFYRPAWQRFMVATQPHGNAPAFLNYPSFDDLFPKGAVTPGPVAVAHPLQLSLHPRNIQLPNSPTDSQQALIDRNRGTLNDINQAGPNNTVGGNLIDQHGHLVYYEIHVSPSFAAFLTKNNLRTVDGIHHLDPNLVLASRTTETTVMELKSAWMIVDSPRAAPNYFVVRAEVPRYAVKNNVLQPQRCFLSHHVRTRKVWAALIALHVVFTLPGHPEMIWSTFEHTHIDMKNGTAVRDNAPAGAYPESNPDIDAVDNSDFPWPLYQRGTTYTKADKTATPAEMVAHWDTRMQSFTKGGLLQTSVYRPYPASKGKGKTSPPIEDDEVVLINKHATTMFDSALKDGRMAESDMRRNYRLVGAVWLDAPLTGTPPSFALNRSFVTDEDSATDDDDSIVAGEGRLGSTAMESFTEMEVGAGGAPSCFSCHDTHLINHNGLLLHPSKLNVSHVLSKYLDTQPRSPLPPATAP